MQTKRNKIDDRQKRRAEHIEENLRRQGIGESEAEKRALEYVAREEPTGRGGGKHSGGEPKKKGRPNPIHVPRSSAG